MWPSLSVARGPELMKSVEAKVLDQLSVASAAEVSRLATNDSLLVVVAVNEPMTLFELSRISPLPL